MSWRLVQWAFDHASIDSSTDLLVLVAIAEEANDIDHSCFPSMRRLAQRCRMSSSATQRAIARLEAAGVIDVVRPKFKGPGMANTYRILTESAGSCPAQEGQNVDAERSETVPLRRDSPEENCPTLSHPGGTELSQAVPLRRDIPIDPSTNPAAAAPKSSFLPGSGNVTPIDRSRPPHDPDPDTLQRIADARARLRGGLG